MAGAGGQGAQKNLAKRKLDNIGDVKAYCGIQNDPERIRKLRAVGELAASISEIARAEKAATAAKKIKEVGVFQPAGTGAGGRREVEEQRWRH